MDSKQRVEIWNTFFKLARDSAASLKYCESSDWQDPGHNWISGGGILDDKDIKKLQLLTWCILAIQSRCSHLMEECKEEGFIDKEQLESFSHLNFKQQWVMLPALRRKRPTKSKNKIIDFSAKPHKAIFDLHDLRDNLFHVNYDTLKKKLDSITSDEIFSYFVDFVDAMEDMNVLLRRGNIRKSRAKVKEIADPFR